PRAYVVVWLIFTFLLTGTTILGYAPSIASGHFSLERNIGWISFIVILLIAQVLLWLGSKWTFYISLLLITPLWAVLAIQTARRLYAIATDTIERPDGAGSP